MHAAFHNRQVKSARLRAIFAYCDWCVAHPGASNGLPDFRRSGVELIEDKPHAVVRTVEGRVLAIYRLGPDGKLRRRGRNSSRRS